MQQYFRFLKNISIWSQGYWWINELYSVPKLIWQGWITYAFIKKSTIFTQSLQNFKSVLFKNVLGTIAWPINSQKLHRWFHSFQRGSFCEFLGHAIVPSTFLNKTDFKIFEFMDNCHLEIKKRNDFWFSKLFCVVSWSYNFKVCFI